MARSKPTPHLDWRPVPPPKNRRGKQLFWYQPPIERGRDRSLPERVVVDHVIPGPRVTTHWADIPNLPNGERP